MSLTIESIKRQYKSYLEKIKQPSGCCQACLSETLNQGSIVTCVICQSSIHSNHYGHQLSGPIKFQGQWKCQRCKFLLQKNFKVQVKCKFCPSQRGIIKKIKFNLNQIWIHPQCSTWCYPIIFQFNNNKRINYSQQLPNSSTSKFWCRIQKQKQAKCQVCSLNQGYKIKCSFYSCQKFYHATCAKKIGVIRDLQSMKFEKSDQYCPPYCETHLQMKVLDCANRIKLYTQTNQQQKVALFTQIHNGYRIQLKNLHMFEKKIKQEEQMRNQLGKQLLAQNCQQSSMSLSITQKSLISQHPSQFYAFLQNKINSQQLQKIIQQKEREEKKNQTKMIMSYKKNIFRQGSRMKNFSGIESNSNYDQSSNENNQNQQGFQQYKFQESGSSSQSSDCKKLKKQQFLQQQQNQGQQKIEQQAKSEIEIQQEQFQSKVQLLEQKQIEDNKLQDQLKGSDINQEMQNYSEIYQQIQDQMEEQVQIQNQKNQKRKHIFKTKNLPKYVKQQKKSKSNNVQIRKNSKIIAQRKSQQQYQSEEIYQQLYEAQQVKQRNLQGQIYEQEYFQEQKQSNSEYSQLYELKGKTIVSLNRELKHQQEPQIQHFNELNSDSDQNKKVQIQRKMSKQKKQSHSQSKKKTQKKRLQRSKQNQFSSSSSKQQSQDQLYELEDEQSED